MVELHYNPAVSATGWSRTNCAHAPTSFCTVVCKCHFPLRWCKALVRGTLFPPLSLAKRRATSNIILNLLSEQTRTSRSSFFFWRDGCAQESSVHHPLVDILWAGCEQDLSFLQWCLSKRVMVCALSSAQHGLLRWWIRLSFRKLYYDFSFKLFFPLSQLRISARDYISLKSWRWPTAMDMCNTTLSR